MSDDNASILTKDRFGHADRNNSTAATTPEWGQGSFVKLYTSFMRVPGLSLAAKWVYLAIVDRIGDNGTAWPGYDRIGKDTNLSCSTVKRAIGELTATGLLVSSSRGPGLSNTYSIPDPATQHKTHPGQNDSGQNGQGTLVKLTSDPGQIDPIDNQTH